MNSSPVLFPGRRSPLWLVWLLLVALGPAAAAAQTPQTRQALGTAIDRVIEHARFRNATWGIVVTDLATGRTLYRHNAAKSLMPASNAKLYTTAAALERLGPGFRYETPLYAEGTVVDGVLRGRLVVRGAGDPTIGGQLEADDPLALFRAWADSLRAAGITRIEGDLVADDNYFDDVALGTGWSWDDEPYYYGAEINALSFMENTVQVSIEGRQRGRAGRVRWEPFETDYVQIVNETVTTARNTRLHEGYARERGSNTIRLYSRVPEGTTDREALSIANPARYFAHTLRAVLRREGIEVTGQPVDVDDLPTRPDYAAPTMRRIAVRSSVPLSQIVGVINTESQNLYAEAVLKTLGAAFGTEAGDGSAEKGLAVATATFARAGVDTSRLQLVDGSGLSRQNLVTPEMTARLLAYMGTHPDRAVREAYRSSLPVGGAAEGSLRNRFTTGPARGNVRAKTGTFSNASALSGYVTTAGGTPLAFALICNHYTTPTAQVRRAQDEIVELLARYPH